MYKKVSVVLGALALMVAIGFGSSQSYAEEHKVYVCHESNHNRTKTISVSSENGSLQEHLDHGDTEGVCVA